MRPEPKRRTPSGEATPKGVLSVLVGNTPEARGELTRRLARRHPEAVTLSVSVQAAASGPYPVVQRLLAARSAPTGTTAPVSSGATGDPTVILRQDLIALRRARKDVRVLLTLPQEIDLLPFLLRLWRHRIGADSLDDHYDCAPVLAAVAPSTFLRRIADTREASRLWTGDGWSEPLTTAEVAARQIEASDTLLVASTADPHPRASAAALLHHLNPRAHVTTLRDPSAGGAALTGRRSPADARETWGTSLEAVALLPPPPDTRSVASSLAWRPRRPLHPARLAMVAADADGPCFFAAEAVLPFLDETDVRSVVGVLGERFPRSWLALDTAGPAIIGDQDRHDALSKVDARMRWSCAGPDVVTGWCPGTELIASHTLSSLPPRVYDRLPVAYQEMLAGLARQRLPQVEEYRLNLFRLP